MLIPQIKCETFLEDINDILSSADIPNLYEIDEQERILAAMKPVVQELGQQPTKANLMAAYIRRVRSNMHAVICMKSVAAPRFVYLCLPFPNSHHSCPFPPLQSHR